MASPTAQAGTCVVLRSTATDPDVLRLVTEGAEHAGYTVASPEAEIAAGATFLEAVDSAIERAAVVVAIVDGSASPWTWFELGLAAAKRQPVLVVVADDAATLPPAISGIQFVGPVLDEKLVARALHQVVTRSVGAATAPKRDRRTGVALGLKADTLEQSLQSLPRTAIGASNVAFEDWFTDLLSAAKVPFEQSAEINNKNLPRAFSQLDFAVSADELSANLGDPLPVELILGSANRVLPGRRRAFESYLTATNARTVLVVSAQNDESNRVWAIPTGDVLICSALSLVREMRSATFGAAVLALRNMALRTSPIA